MPADHQREIAPLPKQGNAVSGCYVKKESGDPEIDEGTKNSEWFDGFFAHEGCRDNYPLILKNIDKKRCSLNKA
jgi:hypothetical protein